VFHQKAIVMATRAEMSVAASLIAPDLASSSFFLSDFAEVLASIATESSFLVVAAETSTPF